MNTPEQIRKLFQNRKGQEIIETGIQSTSIKGSQDHPDHDEKWVWIDFADQSRITIRVALTDEGPIVLGFTEDTGD